MNNILISVNNTLAVMNGTTVSKKSTATIMWISIAVVAVGIVATLWTTGFVEFNPLNGNP